MTTPGSTQIRELIEECADHLADCVGELARYPQTVLVYALRIHLAGLLQALQGEAVLSAEEVREFLAQLTRESLELP